MKIIYRGPGDTVELDGLSIKKGEAIEVTPAQFVRIQGSDPEAKVDVVSDKTPDEDRIRETQAKTRERELRRAEKES